LINFLHFLLLKEHGRIVSLRHHQTLHHLALPLQPGRRAVVLGILFSDYSKRLLVDYFILILVANQSDFSRPPYSLLILITWGCALFYDDKLSDVLLWGHVIGQDDLRNLSTLCWIPGVDPNILLKEEAEGREKQF